MPNTGETQFTNTNGAIEIAEYVRGPALLAGIFNVDDPDQDST
jgi:hypothetical protein